MIMKLELPPELHAGLLSQAREERLSPEAYATQVLEDRIRGAAKPTVDGSELSPEEWMRDCRGHFPQICPVAAETT